MNTPFTDFLNNMPANVIHHEKEISQDGINIVSRFEDNLNANSELKKNEILFQVSEEQAFAALPVIQQFSPNLIKNKDFYNEESLSAVIKKIENADDAFLNSILAYACYKDTLWTITDSQLPLESMTVKIQKGMRSPDELYNLKIWFAIKEFFTPIKDHLFMESQGREQSKYGFEVDYTFKNGQYSAMDDLAHASVLMSKHPTKEGNVLNVAFRGTDFKRLPAFILKAYPDMTAYYQNFVPFEDAVMKFARDPKNNIKEIQISGHSLGGAMVQEFLNRNPSNKNDPEIHGFTFGSPGAKKNLFVKFLNIGYHLMLHHTLVIEKDSKKHDARINEFYHSNDPIPRVGLLGYTRNGIAHNLFDKAYQDSKNANLEKKNFLETVPAFGKMVTYFKETIFNKLNVQFHSSKRYTLNIRDIIEEHYRLYPHLIPEMNKKTQYWQKYCVVENQFRNLTIKYKTAFEYLFKLQYPELNQEGIHTKLLQMREQMKYESPASIVLVNQKLDKVYSRHIQGNNTNLFNPTDSQDISVRVQELRKRYQPIMDSRRQLFKPI